MKKITFGELLDLYREISGEDLIISQTIRDWNVEYEKIIEDGKRVYTVRLEPPVDENAEKMKTAG